MWVQSLGREDPLEEAWPPTPVFLPGKSHGQRSQVVCSPQGHKESDTTQYTGMVHGTLTASSWPPLESGCSNVICHLQNVEEK